VCICGCEIDAHEDYEGGTHECRLCACVQFREDCESVDVVKDLVAALKALTSKYVELIGEAGCYRWDPEKDAEVIAARAAIAKAGS
jgi:hypothetical protein